jgi:cytochrome c553
MKIVLGLVVTLLFMGCNDQKSEEAQEEISHSIEQIAKVVKEESKNITKSVEKVTKDSVKTISKEVQKVSEEAKKVAQKTVVSINKALEKPKKTIEEKVSIDAKALFAKCSSCHGVNGDKKALNKSQIIKGWSVTRLTDAINGYKDGSYGGSMKGVMKPQVNKLSNDEIKALSEYISKLK